MLADSTVWLSWSDSAADYYKDGPEARGSPAANQRPAVRPLLENGDERRIVEPTGRASHPACDWMPFPDAERSAIRTNAAHRTGRRPKRGDVPGNRDPRVDACGFRLGGAPGDCALSRRTGQRGSQRLGRDDLPLRPRVALVADITSGDRNPRSPNLQTFNPMFPTGAYLNLANPIGPANFIQVHPNADVRFGDKVTLLADWAFVWRESVQDGIYGPFTGPPIRTGQLSRAPFVGSSPAVTLTWNATRHTTLLASYVHFFAGPFLKETPPGKDMDYVAFWIDYTF
jgi:hypothetical protein